jgi:hypothetical protein
MAKAKDSRLQPFSWVMGCIHNPKPWRIPMERVKTKALQVKTWATESGFNGAVEVLMGLM